MIGVLMQTPLGVVRRRPRDSRLPRHCSRVGMISTPPNTTTCFPSPL
jgi:hypothetical protein